MCYCCYQIPEMWHTANWSIKYNFVVIFSLHPVRKTQTCKMFSFSSGFTSTPADLIVVKRNSSTKLFEPLPDRKVLLVQCHIYILYTKILKYFAASESSDIKATAEPDKMCRTHEISPCISNLFEDAVCNSSFPASLHSHDIIIITVPVSRWM